MKSVLTLIGTRPEAIKLAPVHMSMTEKGCFKNRICVTRQHTDLLDPHLQKFGIPIHYQLTSCEKEGSLHQSAAHLLKELGEVLAESKPDLLLVQGDTTTAFVGALAGFYACIPVAHLEAGLRTGQLYSPWPEEAHRTLISKLSSYFFAPTIQAQKTLLKEGVAAERIWVVGNTAIDAVRLARRPLKEMQEVQKRLLVATVHRRENHGTPLKEVCLGLLRISEKFPDVRICFMLHPNPAVRQMAVGMLSGATQIELVEPMDHHAFIQLLDAALFIITDSGGIQEEAPFLGKPLLIVRNTTERPEGVEAGTARLVGANASSLVAHCSELLESPETLAAMSKVHFPYGDGYAAERIVNILEKELYA